MSVISPGLMSIAQDPFVRVYAQPTQLRAKAAVEYHVSDGRDCSADQASDPREMSRLALHNRCGRTARCRRRSCLPLVERARRNDLRPSRDPMLRSRVARTLHWIPNRSRRDVAGRSGRAGTAARIAESPIRSDSATSTTALRWAAGRSGVINASRNARDRPSIMLARTLRARRGSR